LSAQPTAAPANHCPLFPPFIARKSRSLPDIGIERRQQDHQIIGVINGVKLNQLDLADESIKQGVQYAVDGQYLCLLTIAVHPPFQRRGVATDLLKSIIQIAIEDGLKGIVLMCEEHLISFYEQHGFRFVAPSASEHGGIQWHEMNLIWK
jgi:ribosomal protein S18 acetylase RimI-like enzyme